MLQKLLQPFVVLLEKKKEGPLLSPPTLLWQSKGEKYKKKINQKISGNHKDSEDRNKDKGRKETSKQHTGN